MELVAQQKQMIAAGFSNAKEIAGTRLVLDHE